MNWAPNRALEPTPPDLLMSFFVVQPESCSRPPEESCSQRGSSCSR